MLERALIEQCSPTLANLKTGNLFSFPCNCATQLGVMVANWNAAFSCKGVSMRVLRIYNGKALIYVYRPARLAKDLQAPDVAEFLSEYGYAEQSPEYALSRLCQRLSQCEQFPHEIGLFLSYPLADVQGFIQHRGANYCCCGCWKVYCNVCETQRLFAKFQKCRCIYAKLFDSGRSILQLTVAA